MKFLGVNYQKELEKIIANNEKEGVKPTLLLQVCCAPCSSYCLEYLHEYFNITVLFYNPNIYPESEYAARESELLRLIDELGFNDINVMKTTFNPDEFYTAVKGFEDCKEGGDRCKICYRLRLEKTAELAKSGGFDYFCTTLSISPLKSAEALCTIGLELEKEYGVKYLLSDFKKKEGYKRSIELSREYNLYRQDYCGCVFSKNN